MAIPVNRGRGRPTKEEVAAREALPPVQPKGNGIYVCQRCGVPGPAIIVQTHPHQDDDRTIKCTRCGYRARVTAQLLARIRVPLLGK